MQKKKLEKKAKKSTKSTKAKGLGDTVEQVLEATGIAKVAKWVLGEDCGCDKRKQILNDLYPYYKIHRKKARDDSNLDWNAIFEVLNGVRDDLKKYFPYIPFSLLGSILLS